MEFTIYLLTLVSSLVLTLAFIPATRKIALKINLVDKPNARKLHQNPIPLVGGIVICISSFLAFFVANISWANITEIKILLFGASILLLMGVIDDKMDMKASYKFLIQIVLSHFAFVNGIRIESMYGILGIYELDFTIQYILTLLVVVGVVNAFNLMDGIDGLAGGLAIIGLIFFSFLAFLLGKTYLIILYLALIGALLGFLKFNFSKNQKIFMGDAGSLFLGYILVVSAIILLQSAHKTQYSNLTLVVILGVFIIPVLDSLRVYFERIQEGKSPFEADKRHLHHLVLLLGLKHKKATFSILLSICFYIVFAVIIGYFLGINFTLILLFLSFFIFKTILNLNKKVYFWKTV